MKAHFKTSFLLALTVLWGNVSLVLGAPQSSCGTASWNAGSYKVMTNYWNQTACPGTQCVTMNDTNGDFGVTQMTANCTGVASYPAIYYGCHYGNCSTGSALPVRVSALSCVTSNWTVTTTNSGVWDAAYDIWFCTGAGTCTGGYDGAELMIWFDYLGASPLGSQIASNVSIAGKTWNVWEGRINSTTSWNVISYEAVTKFDSASALDVKAFITDAVNRGYINTAWYLTAIEAGIEITKGGVPFTSKNFYAAVNTGCGPTSTPTPTFSPTPVACSNTFNGFNSLTENGTWSGANATRTIMTTGYPAGSKTEGSGLMHVQITTGAAYNGDILIMNSSFAPNPIGGYAQLWVDVYAETALITALGSYHSVDLIGESTTQVPPIYWERLSSDSPTLVAGQQTLVFRLDYPDGNLASNKTLTGFRLALNAQNPGTGNLYFDNMRLVNTCGLPTATPTPCSVMFNNADTLTANGNWTGVNATRSIVTSGGTTPAGAVVQGTGALKVQVTAPSTYNTDLFNLDSFAPGNWYGVTRFQASVNVDASLLAGQSYNQMLLFADSYPATTFQPISSSAPSVVAGSNTLVWNIDYKVPGTGAASGITAGMPLTKLIFIWNNGPVATNVGNFYVDNLLMLRDGCLPTPTNTATFTVTKTSTSTQTSTPAITNTSTLTATGTATRTYTPSPTPAVNTSTATFTPSRSATSTSTPVANTSTSTPTRTPTSTSTPVANTSTPTLTLTRTATSTSTTTLQPGTSTSTSTATLTPSRTSTASATSTASLTSTRTLTQTFSPTMTFSQTSTPVPGASTSTSTSTPSVTATSSSTSTPVPATLTSTPSRTSSATSTSTQSATSTRTLTATASLTSSPIPGASTSTSTSTPSVTATSSSTASTTATLSPTLTASRSATPTFSSTLSATLTATSSQTSTPVPGASTSTSTPTPSSTSSATSTSTRTVTPTLTFTSQSTFTSTNTLVNTPTITPTATRTSTQTLTSTSTSTALATLTQTATQTSTLTVTPTPTVQAGATPVLSANPADGHPIDVLPQSYTGLSDVIVQIYTTGMRMVQSKDYGMMPLGWVTVELVDNQGQALAGGLYYVRVITKTGVAMTKLLIVR